MSGYKYIQNLRYKKNNFRKCYCKDWNFKDKNRKKLN